jgi:hypothetical protein
MAWAVQRTACRTVAKVPLPPPSPAHGEPRPPGWHLDPHDPSHWRYFDGTQWTEYRRPVENDQDAFSVRSLTHQVAAVAVGAVRRSWVAVLVPWLAVAGVVLVAGLTLWNNPAAIEVRDVLSAIPDNAEPDVAYQYLADNLTAETVIDLLRALAVWAAAVFGAYVLAVSFTTATVALAADAELRDEPIPFKSLVVRSVRRTPAMVAVYLGVYVAPTFSLAVVASLLVVAGVPLLLIVPAVAAAVAGVAYLVVRSSLVAVSVATGQGLGAPAAKAFSLVKGRWWAVLGRLILAALAATVVAMVLDLVPRVGMGQGLAAAFVLVVAVRVVSSLVGTALSVATQLCMVRALERTDSGPGR